MQSSHVQTDQEMAHFIHCEAIGDAQIDRYV